MLDVYPFLLHHASLNYNVHAPLMKYYNTHIKVNIKTAKYICLPESLSILRNEVVVNKNALVPDTKYRVNVAANLLFKV